LYIHELREWPNFSWDAGRLDPLLKAVAQERAELFEQLSNSCFDELGQSLREEASVQMLTQEVLKTSEIEGEKLDPSQVRSSIAKKLGLNLGGLRKEEPQRGRSVDGIVTVVLDATHRWEEPLTAERLCSWHSLLFPNGWNDFGAITIGKWREGPMQVVSSPFNKQRVHFVAPEAARLQKEMDEFLGWFESKEDLDPILKAGIAHLYFVTIHPFDDGNGRLARAIADLALSRADREKQRFYSMSAQIRHERKDYYEMLEQTQKGTLDITEWLEWFLNCLLRSIQWAKEALQAVIRKAAVSKRMATLDLNDRQLKVMLKYLDGGFGEVLNTSKYRSALSCSADTANRDLSNLAELGLLERTGQGRSTSYSIKE